MRGKRAKEIRRLAKAEAEKQAKMIVDDRTWRERLHDWWRGFWHGEKREIPILNWRRNHRFLKRFYKEGSSR